MELQEWKERHRKTITTKSGLVVTVRRMSPFALGLRGGAPGIDPIQPENQTEVTKSILYAAVLEPKLGEGPGELSFYDLDAEDTNEIMDAIAGITKREEGSIPLASTA